MKRFNLLYASAFSILLPLHAFAGTGQTPSQGQGQGQGQGQTPNQGETPQQQEEPGEVKGELTAQERTVLQTIHMTNLTEIKASLIAFEKVTSPEIRKYAWTVVQDHIALESKIIALSEKYQFELVSSDPSFVGSQTEANTLIATLTDTPDAEFANVFLTSMGTAQDSVLARLEGWQKSVVALDVKDFLAESIMGIKDHQALAETIVTAPAQ